MPSKQINVILSGGSLRYKQEVYGLDYRRGYYWNHDYRDVYVGDATTEIGFFNSFSIELPTNIDFVIPENAFFTGLKFRFYVSGGRVNKTLGLVASVNIGSRHIIPIRQSFSTGWNEISFRDMQDSNYKGKTIDIGYATGYGLQYSNTTPTVEVAYINRSRPIEDYSFDGVVTKYSRAVDPNDILRIKDQRSSYPPTIIVEYEYNKPVSPDNLAPDNTAVNPKLPIRFSWNSKINQIKYELEYNWQGWKKISNTSGDRYYILPAGTITQQEGDIPWRVRVAEESGVFSNWTNAVLTIGSVPQPKPVITSPNGDYIEANKPVKFEWIFVPSSSETQKAYELSYNRGNGWVTLSETTDKQETTRDLRVDESRTIYWKLRVKNQYDEWSEWTDEASFQIVAKPTNPQIISVDNNNKPMIKWNAREQAAYVIEIEKDDKLVYTTGIIASTTDRSYQVPQILANGKYIIKILTMNSYGMKSQKISFTHIINPEPIEAPTCVVYNGKYCVTVTTDTENGIILRDGKKIGTAKDGKFEDYTGINQKNYKYSVRAIKNNVYGDSESFIGKVNFQNENTLAVLDKPEDFYRVIYNVDTAPVKSVSYRVQASEITLEGLEYPLVEYGETRQEEIEIEFLEQSKEELEHLKNLISQNKQIIYRDNRGVNYIGYVKGINVKYHTLGYIVNFSVIRTKENE